MRLPDAIRVSLRRRLRATTPLRRMIRRGLGLSRYAAVRRWYRKAVGLPPIATPFSPEGGTCPVCGAALPAFAVNEYGEWICPDCLSYPRTRAAMLYFEQRVRPRLERGEALRLLHFSPFPEKRKALSRYPALSLVAADYLASDLPRGAPSACADMEDLPFREGSFDLAIALAVVPFVRRDRRAFRELARVLKPGGALLLETTIFGEATQELYTPGELERLRYCRKPTFEGLLPQSKWESSGQLLHDPRQYVRRHGLDVRERLSAAGFEARPITFESLCRAQGAAPAHFGLADSARAVLFECIRRSPEEAS